MLNNSALSQLTQLKSEIQASKEYGTGTVAGTSGKFGFVRLDDGRDAFLSPEKMQRVLPGDKVKVCLKTNDKNKLEADFEALLSTSLDRFIGQYKVKGSAHFVVPTGNQSSRWIFIPPKSRGKCQDGDFVVTKLLSHPYKDGKASAKVLERIGQENDVKIENKYIRAKYDLNPRDEEKFTKPVAQIEQVFEKEDFGDRTNLEAIPFVTIDSASTKDMDDAVAIEKVEIDGAAFSRLHVAIADPASFIARGSVLAKQAESLSQTVYLLGRQAPMLPSAVSHACFALEADKVRPSLVCHIDIDSNGRVHSYNFEKAIIRSRHKLTYNNVTHALDTSFPLPEGESPVPEEHQEQLSALFELSSLRRQYREQHHLVGSDQPDYDYKLDEQGRVSAINKRAKTLAHQIVEEAMLATNTCAGEFLAEKGVGLHVRHGGFRDDRMGEVKAVLKEEGIEHGDNINDLEEHRELLKKILTDEEKSWLIFPLRRMMQIGEISNNKGPHMSMGLPAYATMTSPIRRFADLYNHWIINDLLAGKEVDAFADDRLEKLGEALNNCRQADRELHHWLITQYAQSKVGETAKGRVRIVTQQGFGVKLDDTGIEGFVLFPKKKEKKFDAKRMTITVDEKLYRIDQEVEISIKSIDMEKRRIAFELVSQNENNAS